jgi:hypothetical protein
MESMQLGITGDRTVAVGPLHRDGPLAPVVVAKKHPIS